jgi:hypothetical protein
MIDRPSPHRSPGQVIVVFAIALVALVGMVGLLIDGGTVFAQQRVAQNGADGAATAGALVIAQHLGPATRTGDQVFDAIESVADASGLENWTAIYTDDFGDPIGQDVVDTGAIPTGAEGVQVRGEREVNATFARVIGVNELTAAADAIVVAGNLSGDCVADEDGCTFLPITFPVKVPECDGSGELLPGGTWIGAPPPSSGGEGYWPVVGEEALPTDVDPDGDESSMAILPLCKGSGESTGAYGFIDVAAGMNLQDEIVGPLNTSVDIPDWFQVQNGTPNSVEAEIELYLHQPVLIPLHNQACREDPGDTEICSLPGVDPTGNNTWYYVHTLGVFWIYEVNVQGSNVDECASEPGAPLVPFTTGGGFFGCLKGWFVNYVEAGPIAPGGEGEDRQGAIGIQLIR